MTSSESSIRAVEGALADALEVRALAAYPEEAVGLLTNDGRIFELPNHAPERGANFRVYKEDILSCIRMNELEDDLVGLTLWHSHPNGGVGPSRIDMQQRLPFLQHLVVTLESSGAIFTWY